MILLCIVAVIMPLFGWIIGGLNMNSTKHSKERRQQALALIIIGVVFFLIFLAAAGA